MALAILELLDFDKARAQFRIDTGTNRYYQLKVGRSVRRKQGIEWVDNVVVATPMSMNRADGGLLNSSKEISIPAPRFGNGNAYAQLFSFKTPQGKSPAFSRVIKVGMGFRFPSRDADDTEIPLSISKSMNMNGSFQTPRTIECLTYSQTYSEQASLEDLLGKIVKLAAPAVLNLLGGAKKDGPQNGAAGTATGGSVGVDVLANLLKEILGGIQGAASTQQSVFDQPVYENRFFPSGNTPLSSQFIFGIDDALLASLAGPALQILPQLMNAANAQRLQMKQENNKLMTGILATVNQRMLQDKLLEAQRQATADAQAGKAAEIAQLIQLLQAQAEIAAASPAATPAKAQSLSLDNDYSSTFSNKAVLSFVTADPVPWNGMPKVVFAKSQPVQLKIQFNVAEPAPKKPLPKAILKIIFKNALNQAMLFEKTFKQKDVMPNSAITFSFAAGELAHLPVNQALVVLAEVRWQGSKTKQEYKALGSAEFTLANKYFLKDQGNTLIGEQELTDMSRFRPFWNKVWEAPSLDKAGVKRDDSKKYLWELDVNTKYSVLLSPVHDANGLMTTKVLRGRKDEESLSEKTEGRMKAGIELSLTELNKLIPLWKGESVLDADKLEAFKTEAFAKNNATEFVYHLRLKGRAGERGMIWVIPTFKLAEFTLSMVQKINDAGQVIAVSDEKVRFPLPVSARVIGLKSQQ
jgi:hypothetical protein